MTSQPTPLVFYGYWRSNAAYRVRVAMNLKGLAFQEIMVDLDAGEQLKPDFLARNPFGAVPALLDGDRPPLTQSLAILEYLEERTPEPPLLPEGARARALARALAADVACDSHPLIVSRIKAYLTNAGFDAATYRAWQQHWVATGLQAIEAKLAASPDAGRFCVGDRVSMADICVAGLLMIDRLFGFDTPGIPTVERIVERCWELEAFGAADPTRQPGAPKFDPPH